MIDQPALGGDPGRPLQLVELPASLDDRAFLSVPGWTCPLKRFVSGLPLTYATVIVFEVLKVWLASERSMGEALVGKREGSWFFSKRMHWLGESTELLQSSAPRKLKSSNWAPVRAKSWR